jgi:hypothetical protein
MPRIIKLLVLLAALAIGASAMAYSSFVTTFKTTYPAASNSALAHCVLCHIDPAGGGPLNSYGDAFLAAGASSFTTIESLDSDGDGYSNLAEIQALTFPGDATSFPAATSYILTVAMAGTGSGTVTPDSGTLSWAGSVGTATYAANTLVTLTATPATGSTFSGWSGACVGNTNTCAVTMSQAQSVTATFAAPSCSSQLIKVGGTSSFYPTIQDAYNVLTNGQSLELQMADFTENLLLQNNTTIALVGGYGCDFLSNTGYSTIIGSVTINGGTIVMDNVIIR